jgi:1-acyl-sn-glycerol-3-phosphate acyltransferase
MDAGFSILIFPEGRHVPEPDIEAFRKGIGIFARGLRAPVIPAYVEGTAFVLPDGRYWPRFGKTRLILGPPLFIDPDADAAEATRQIEEAVRRLRVGPAAGGRTD